jgi:competence protein ComGC
MKRLIAIAVLVAVPAIAQQPAPPSQEEVNALLQAVAAQREQYANIAAQLSSKLTVIQAELDKAKAASCKPTEKK